MCYVIFVDHRPKKYDKVIGSFSHNEYKARRKHSSRVAKIQIFQHPQWFHLEANSKSYGRIMRFFETTPKRAPITLLLEKGAIRDLEHSNIVYKIIVNNSVIFDRVREDAIINETISLIKN